MATADEKESKTLEAVEPEHGRVSQLIERITDDLKAIGRDELELARAELTKKVKLAGIDAAVIILSGVILLIGIGFLSVAAVDALAPVIPPLWGRLVLMGVVYVAICAALLFSYAGRLKRDVAPEMPATMAEAKRTVEAVKEELRHA